MATKKKSTAKATKRRITRDTRTPAAPEVPPVEQALETRSIVFIVNGHRTTLLVKASDTIQQHRDKVLTDAGYVTGPDWETRTYPGGELIADVGMTFRDAKIVHGCELTVSPRAGTQG